MEFENKILKACGWNEILSECFQLHVDVLVSPTHPPGVLVPLEEAVPGPLKRRAGDFNSKRVLILIGIGIPAAVSALKFYAQFLEGPLCVWGWGWGRRVCTLP